MIKKKTILVILFIIIISSISGCGNNSSGVEESKSEEKESSTEATTEELIDNTAPEINVRNDILSCKTGEQIQFDKYFTVTDDIDEAKEIKTEIDDTKVDYDNPGKYTVSVSATDLSNNTSIADLDLYIFKDYEYEEIREILNKLIDEKYYDFNLIDNYADSPEKNNYQFEINDGTGATDSPTGSPEIVGYIDWIMCCAGLDVSVSRNDSHKNNNVSWNSDICISVVEYTNYGTIQEISKVEFVSKNGKITLSNPDDVIGNWIHSVDDPDYKLRNLGLCFSSEEDLEKFENIIDGINPTIIFISDSESEITRIKMTDVDVENFKAALNLYHDINKYICNVPKNKKDISSSTDATSTDAGD